LKGKEFVYVVNEKAPTGMAAQVVQRSEKPTVPEEEKQSEPVPNDTDSREKTRSKSLQDRA